ncbi:hypothetical protein Q5752_006834 [Cryptotrichosporon argae]
MDPVRKRKPSDDDAFAPLVASGGSDPSPDLSKVRAYAACKSCRTKKVKCRPGPAAAAPASEPGAPPVPGRCAQCTQAGLDCVYPPTRDRAAYSRQYVQNLEARVQLLEHAHARIAPLLAAFEGGALPLAPPASGMTAAASAQAHAHAGPSRHADVADAASDADDDDVDAGAEDDSGNGAGSGEDEPEHEHEPEHEGRMARDERGNYRWLGASNALSLLDSFRPAARGRAHDNDAPDGGSDNADVTAAGPRAREPELDNPYFGPVAGAGIVQALPHVKEVTYPPRQYAESLVEAFLADVHPVLPVVLEHEFRADFGRIMDNVDRGEREGYSAGALSVVFAIFALGERVLVGSRAWQRERRRAPSDDSGETVLPGEAEAGVIWFERAQVLHWTDKQVSIEQVQCLTLLAAFQASVNAMPMAWILAGQAIRIAQDIGLHRHASKLHMSLAKRQLGGRCWWAIYGLERMISVTLGRPLAVDDLDVDVPYPAVLDDAALARLSVDAMPPTPADVGEEPHDAVMSGFVALTKLSKIAGRVAQLLFRPSHGKSVNDLDWASSLQSTIDRLDKLLRQWLETEVPGKYKNHSGHNHPVSRMSAVLSNSYFAVLITLHRNLLPSNPDFPRPTPLTSTSLAHCVDAARSVIHIAAISDILLPPSHHLAVHSQFLWSSAVVLLLCEVRAKDQAVVDTVGRDVDSCRRSLRNLEPVWPGARKLKELLVDVEHRARAVRAVAATATATARPAHKKRKSSHDGARRPTAVDRPSSRPSPASARASPSSATPHPFTPHAQARYETSDTRTIVPAERRPPLSAPPSSGSAPGALASVPPTPAIGHANFSSQAVLGPPYVGAGAEYELFDVGGMAFEGLEMLQAFTGETWGAPPGAYGASHAPPGSAAMYPTLSASAGPTIFAGSTAASPVAYGTAGQVPPPAGAYEQQQQLAAYSHAHAHAQNVSHPQQAAQQQPQTPTMQQDGLWWVGPDGRAVPDISELWSQVAGSAGFDWQADPSVPFNV